MAEAKRLSAEAVALAAPTDWLSDRADALLSQAQVLRMAGDTRAAMDAFQDAIGLYARKGNTIAARHARSSLDIQVPV